MSDVQIFVEGVADQKFLQDLIAEWYGVNLTRGGFFIEDKVVSLKPGDILDLKGKNCFQDDKKMHELKPIIQTLRAGGIPILVIFDADDFKKDHAVLTGLSQKYGFQFFLLPYNGTHPETDKNNGDLESLLEEIICPENKVIFDCWQAFEQCLSAQTTQNTASGKFTIPAPKTKIHNYVQMLVGTSKTQKDLAKEENRDYRNKKHWNLNPAHPHLQPLKAFLDHYFSTPQ